MKVIYARQTVDAGWLRLPEDDAVAAVCCCHSDPAVDTEFCRYLRSLYPATTRIAIICDNFSSHLSTRKDRRVGTWATANNVEIAYTPRAGQHDPTVHHLAQQPRLRRTPTPHRRPGKRSLMRASFVTRNVHNILMAPRQVTPLRYYLYVSDNKLEMLFEQIDQGARKRISAELKIDLKIASLTLSQSDDPAPTRSAKLRIVERFIDLHHNVGNNQEPGQEYFRSKMSMRWGRVLGGSVLFIGSDGGSSTRVILLGSFNNVLGVDLPRLEGYSRSQLFHIIRTLRELEHRRDSNLPHLRIDPEGVPLRIDPEGVWLQRVWYKLSSMDSIAHSAEKDSIAALPPQQLEYLGIPLLESSREVGEPHIVLGTPLYVAMAR